MIDFYQKLAAELSQHSVVMATVTQVQGSTPREVGAKMIVCADHKTIGTIGGGAGEAKVCHQALQVLATGTKTFVDIDLSGSSQRETQGICGGRMRVLLERWDKALLSLVDQILDVLTHGKPGAMVTSFAQNQIPHFLEESVGTIQITPTFLIEPLSSSPALLIVGAGHVAISLAQVAHLAGFQIMVTDDRADFATAQRFPCATQVLAAPIDQALDRLPRSIPLYAALVTRGFQQDVAALQALLHRETNYIGMIGSRKRVQEVFHHLIQHGFSPSVLDKIYAPIGLDIGALTPEEIAVSICAELIKVRRKGMGRFASRSSGSSLSQQ